jgi:tRNA A-37 threonylcarbamoyl transferase component Bud32
LASIISAQLILEHSLNHYQDPVYEAALQRHGLDTFEAWWTRDIAWFEAPNQRRGGWSGVGKLVLPQENLPALTLFVKKQQNHGRRTLCHPFAGEPTFRREYHRLQSLAKAGIPAPKVLMYAESPQAGNQRAILVTENLHGFVDLEQLLPSMLNQPQHARRQLLRAVARQIRRFHDLGWVHRALYPKHIFVRPDDVAPDVALIDLEKARQSLGAWRRARFDLAALHRHTAELSDRDRLYFLKHYLYGETYTRPLGWCDRQLLKWITKRSKR